MRILVTGSRMWADEAAVQQALGQVSRWRKDPEEPITLIHGGAAGLDSLADDIGGKNGWYIESYRVEDEDWLKHGAAAGPLRNNEMIAEKPEICLAFPLVVDSWSGTMQCMAAADAAGIPVVVNGKAWTRADYKGLVPSYYADLFKEFRDE